MKQLRGRKTTGSRDHSESCSLRPDDQRVNDTVKADRFDKRPQVAVFERLNGLELSKRQQPDRLAGCGRELIHIMLVGAHAITARETLSFPARVVGISPWDDILCVGLSVENFRDWFRIRH
jgi:hypothetical protein